MFPDQRRAEEREGQKKEKGIKEKKEKGIKERKEKGIKASREERWNGIAQELPSSQATRKAR